MSEQERQLPSGFRLKHWIRLAVGDCCTYQLWGMTPLLRIVEIGKYPPLYGNNIRDGTALCEWFGESKLDGKVYRRQLRIWLHDLRHAPGPEDIDKNNGMHR